MYPVREKGVDNLWLQPLDGGPGRQLTNFGFLKIYSYQWSPDGKSLALVRGDSPSDLVFIANMLLVRATARQREMAIRTAIGAGWGRLVRQSVTESLVLALLGGFGGLLLGWWASGFLSSLPLGTTCRSNLIFNLTSACIYSRRFWFSLPPAAAQATGPQTCYSTSS